MKTLFLIAAIVCASIGAHAADVDVNVRSHQSTTSPAGSRFEVIQSTLAARWTFKLDKYTGKVWQLVRTKEDDNAWEDMRVIDRPSVSTPLRPRFQIFTSGLAARHTFLFDTDTGKTWTVVTGKRKESDGTESEYNAWQPFAE